MRLGAEYLCEIGARFERAAAFGAQPLRDHHGVARLRAEWRADHGHHGESARGDVDGLFLLETHPCEVASSALGRARVDVHDLHRSGRVERSGRIGRQRRFVDRRREAEVRRGDRREAVEQPLRRLDVGIEERDRVRVRMTDEPHAAIRFAAQVARKRMIEERLAR